VSQSEKWGLMTMLSAEEHDALVQEFMNVAQVNPGRCDDKVFKEGKFFCMLAGPRMWTIERMDHWVTDDVEVNFTASRLQHLLRAHGCRPLDDRQAAVLAQHINELQGKIDDLNDQVDQGRDRGR